MFADNSTGVRTYTPMNGMNTIAATGTNTGTRIPSGLNRMVAREVAANGIDATSETAGAANGAGTTPSQSGAINLASAEPGQPSSSPAGGVSQTAQTQVPTTATLPARGKTVAV